MTTTYVFTLNENKYFVTEIKNEVIETIEQMIKKLMPNCNFSEYDDLLCQNLGKTISSLEWIKKYPIEKITKTNYNLERIFFNYVKNYGIDNVRSDVYKDIELSEGSINYIQTVLNDSKEPIPIRISLLDMEINKLKNAYDSIVKNNSVIQKYTNYSTNLILQKIDQEKQLKYQIEQNNISSLQQRIQLEQQLQRNQQDLQQKQQELQGKQKELQLEIQENRKLTQKYQHYFQSNYINTLLPYFIDTFIKENKIDSRTVKSFLINHFSDHKLVEEITNALLLKKQNEKLITKYGTSEVINEKLSEMFYKKIELIHQLELDDVNYGTKNDMKYDIKYYKDEY
jgi:hypothetical protein